MCSGHMLLSIVCKRSFHVWIVSLVSCQSKENGFAHDHNIAQSTNKSRDYVCILIEGLIDAECIVPLNERPNAFAWLSFLFSMLLCAYHS